MNPIQKIDQLAGEFTARPALTNVYGLARTVLALGPFLTLLANDATVLFPESAVATKTATSSLVEISLFNLLAGHLWLAKGIALLILGLVIIGWRPRFTGVLHWYVAFSFFSACSVIDGGDHVSSIMALWFVPLTLLDNRKWHWQSADYLQPMGKGKEAMLMAAWAVILLIRIQVAVIYLHAGEAKLQVDEWANGTAVYYWFTHHYHGAASWLKPLVQWALSHKIVVMAVTWGTMIFELVLFAALFMNPNSRRRKALLVLGIAFHFGIVLIHGLISFFCSMACCLIIYLRPADKPFNFGWVVALKTKLLGRGLQFRQGQAAGQPNHSAQVLQANATEQ